VKDSKVLTVDIEPGFHVGQQISFYGESDQYPDVITGDVVFILKAQEDDPSIFERQGNDLYCKQKITLSDALFGAKLIITHLDQKQVLVSVPAGVVIQPGEKRKVAKQGMPIF